MNTELFDKLIEQATCGGAPQIGIDDYLNEYELICLVVKECAIVGNHAENNAFEIRSIYEVILSHFGIENDF